MLRRALPAMGTEIELLLDAPAGPRAERALGAAQALLVRLERLLSRFHPGSELSRLNAEGRRRVAPELAEVVELALAARERTGGRYDPTVHDAVVHAGYDRTFAELPPDGPPALPPAPGGGAVAVDGTLVLLGQGVRLDLGGIAKGYAADRACDMLAQVGPCLVNAGGDLAVRGGCWPVAVTGELTLELTAGGMATTGRDRRRWQRGGRQQHHVIDPRTGVPATTPVLRATVVAGTAAEAEALATAAFLGAPPDLPHVLVLADGRTVVGGGLG